VICLDFLNMSAEELLTIFYIWGNIVAWLLSSMLYFKSRKNKQTQSQYFNRIVLSLGIYFIGDAFWALSYFNIIPNPSVWIKVARIIYYGAAGFLGYFWFIYVEMVLGASFVYRRKRRGLLYIPVVISSLNTIMICLVGDPSTKDFKGYLTGFALIIIPFIFVIAAGIHVLIKRTTVTDKGLKLRYRNMGVWPIVILCVSVLQLFIAELPIFCFGSIIIVVALYVYNQDSMIFTDPLTGINNRNMLNRFIQDGIGSDDTYYVMMIDIDKFKSINDTYGHLEGDKALKYMAKLLKEESAKNGDFLARYGGDEFIIIIKATSDMDVIKLSNAIKDAAATTKTELGYEFTASVGYAKVMNGGNIDEAILRADQSLYEAKEVAHARGLR